MTSVVATSLCDVGAGRRWVQIVLFQNTPSPDGPQGRGYNISSGAK